MKITGTTRLAGIMGWPVSHSRSPLLHGFWLDETGTDGAYIPLPVRPEHIAQALRALPVLGFRGCNLTIPHKQTALSVADRVEPSARRIGAVNTIIVAPDGTLEARNTDVFGFRENLRETVPDWQPTAGPAVILGAGGSARAVVAALTDAGVTEIRIVNRSFDRAQKIAEEFGAPLTALKWEQRSDALEDAAMVVNTTSQGMVGQSALDINIDKLPQHALVADIIYTPLETPFLAAARKRGNATVNGLGMLLHQGRPAWKAWFGIEPVVTAELRAIMEKSIREGQ